MHCGELVMHLSFSIALSLLGLMGLTPVTARESENAIVGPLNVTCHGSSAQVNFKTKTPFNGRVYVKGAYSKVRCNHDFSGGNFSEGTMEMPLYDCGSQQEQTIGYTSAFTNVIIIIVSFHPKLITKNDKSYKIECQYQRGESEVLSALNVSDLTTEVYTYRPPSPACQYTLHTGSLNGPMASYVQVGDALFHKWTCDSGMYVMFVHNCYATGPGQERIELLDDTGCALDESLMPNLTYSNGTNEAWVETQAFRYQEVDSVRFNCKITTCLKEDTSCTETLPKPCSLLPSPRRVRQIVDSGYLNDQVIFSAPINLALPFGDEEEGNGNDIANTEHENTICFNRSAAAALAMAVCILICLLVCTLPVALAPKRKREGQNIADMFPVPYI